MPKYVAKCTANPVSYSLKLVNSFHSCAAELVVRGSRGGVWRFPVHLSATPAAPDDIITLKALGLNKETQLGFRLTSMHEYVPL